LRELLGIGCTHHQHAVATAVPSGRGELGDGMVETSAAIAYRHVLEVARTGVGGATENHDAALLPPQERLQRVAAEVRIYGDRIGSISLESLDGIALGGAADVAALGVENDRHVGVDAM